MQIVSGRFKPDEKLPAEALLCEEYAVSRPVLREATRVLVAKGLVYSRPRVGTVVKARREWHLLDPDVLHWIMQSTPQNEFFNLLTSVRAKAWRLASCSTASRNRRLTSLLGVMKSVARVELRMFSSAAYSRSWP